MNFSDWVAGPGSNPNLEMSWLTLMCSAVETRRMPPRRYLLLHSEARLSKRQIDTFCLWSRAETARLGGKSPSAVTLNGVAASDQIR
jgi:hypothetical protein